MSDSGCSWCVINSNGELLDKQYCSAMSKCYLGREGQSVQDVIDENERQKERPNQASSGNILQNVSIYLFCVYGMLYI